MPNDTERRTRWLGRRALVAHLVILVWVPGCLVAAWWQATIAMAGNALSYLYALEWPAFAIFGVVVWWNVVHDNPETHGNRRLYALTRRQRSAGQGDKTALRSYRADDEDPALGAYNDYLERLSRQQEPKTWRRQ